MDSEYDGIDTEEESVESGIDAKRLACPRCEESFSIKKYMKNTGFCPNGCRLRVGDVFKMFAQQWADVDKALSEVIKLRRDFDKFEHDAGRLLEPFYREKLVGPKCPACGSLDRGHVTRFGRPVCKQCGNEMVTV
jgi:uncharacterized protein (DUF983 family)